MRDCEARVAKSPRLSPAYVELGEAYLEKAEESADPAWIAKARQAINRSLELQPNYDAMILMMRVCNYAHRFEDALKWAWRAVDDGSVNGRADLDPVLLAGLVEGYLSLGQIDEAGKLFSQVSKDKRDFFIYAARGKWLAASGRPDEAVSQLQLAARFGRESGVPVAEVWALGSAGGVLIDAGRADEAVPFLDDAERIDHNNAILRLHRAELLESRGKWKEALSLYELALKGRDDAEIHLRAYKAARRVGDEAGARDHFAKAERGFQHAIDAGEVYSLGALAELYAEGGVKLDRAVALAEQNLKYRRDTHARELLRSLRARFDAS
jgi:tetratricopeptide (TPR) repeat protein